MQVTKSAASQLVTWLERHGLVERVPDPADRRATLVRATSAADAGFRAARHRYAEIEDEWERAIGPESLAKLAAMLSELDSLRPQRRLSPGVREAWQFCEGSIATPQVQGKNWAALASVAS
jgi:hypothetical protein